MLLNIEPSLQSLFLFSRFFYLRTLARQITILHNLLKFTYETNILIFCLTSVYVCAHTRARVCGGQISTTGVFICSPPHVLRQGLLLSSVPTNWLEWLASGTRPCPTPSQHWRARGLATMPGCSLVFWKLLISYLAFTLHF